MKKSKIVKVIENVLISVLVLIGLLTAVSLLPVKNIYKIYTVMSGSMEPTIQTGSIIVSMPRDNYDVGEVITYKDKLSSHEITTHRIAEVKETDGAKEIFTKGDANDNIDSEAVLESDILGEYIFGIPYLGYLVSYLKNPIGLILIIIIPATIIIYEEIRKIRKELLRTKDKKISDKITKKSNNLNSERKKKNEKNN